MSNLKQQQPADNNNKQKKEKNNTFSIDENPKFIGDMVMTTRTATTVGLNNDYSNDKLIIEIMNSNISNLKNYPNHRYQALLQ